MLISQLTANRLKLKAGDDLLMYFVQEGQPARKRKFKIVGIFNLGVDEVDKTFVIGDLALIRRLNNWKKGEIGGYEVRIDDFEQLGNTADAIDDKLPINFKSNTVNRKLPNHI
jgi:lipoprotein-releasing system permease protein